MSATVQDLFDRTTAILDRTPVAVLPGAFTNQQFFNWIKDAYNRITDLCRIPKVTVTTSSTIGLAAFPLPADCWDGLDGIVYLTFNGYPIRKTNELDLQDAYGSSWKTPPACVMPQWYVDGDDSDSVNFIPAPAAVFPIVLKYVQEQPAPTAVTTPIPYIFQPYVDIIPDYIIAQAMELDRQGRGAAKAAEFDARLLRKYRKKNRSTGRRQMSEAYTLGFDNYRFALRRGRYL